MKPLNNWLLTGMAIWFLLTLFPPFVGGNSSGEEKFIGFHFLFGTPKYKSPNQQVQRSYSHIDGEKKIVSEKRYYPKREYVHYRIDSARYTLLIILTLITLAMMFVGLQTSKPFKE
jgi:hypothetical protein